MQKTDNDCSVFPITQKSANKIFTQKAYKKELTTFPPRKYTVVDDV